MNTLDGHGRLDTIQSSANGEARSHKKAGGVVSQATPPAPNETGTGPDSPQQTESKAVPKTPATGEGSAMIGVAEGAAVLETGTTLVKQPGFAGVTLYGMRLEATLLIRFRDEYGEQSLTGSLACDSDGANAEFTPDPCRLVNTDAVAEVSRLVREWLASETGILCVQAVVREKCKTPEGYDFRDSLPADAVCADNGGWKSTDITAAYSRAMVDDLIESEILSTTCKTDSTGSTVELDVRAKLELSGRLLEVWIAAGCETDPDGCSVRSSGTATGYVYAIKADRDGLTELREAYGRDWLDEVGDAVLDHMYDEVTETVTRLASGEMSDLRAYARDIGLVAN